MGKRYRGVAPFLLVIFILGMIIYAGPANALIVEMMLSKNDYEETIKLNLNIEADDNELVKIEEIVFHLKNFHQTKCRFSLEGEIIEGCENIEIIARNRSEYGYGYGYGYGYNLGKNFFEYELTINSSNLLPGKYSAEFIIISEEVQQNIEKEFEIKGIFEKCSLRAKNGFVFNNETIFQERTLLNFKIHDENARGSGGYLVSQDNKNRFSYNFDVKGILKNTENELIISVFGEKKINRNNSFGNAIIYIDKIEKKARIEGDDFYADDMDVSFLRGC